MKDKNSQSAWKDSDINDTKELQVYSLCEFMRSLHYEYSHPGYIGTGHFRSSHFSNKGRGQVSFSTAVKLYNCQGVAKSIFGKPNIKLGIWSFNDYSLAKAKASRILKSIKLQYCKKTKSIICQDHRIQFVESSYTKLFLGNRYLNV